jgi:hypothetical protein
VAQFFAKLRWATLDAFVILIITCNLDQFHVAFVTFALCVLVRVCNNNNNKYNYC